MISTDVADVRNPLGHCRLLLGLFLLNLFLHMPHVISEKAAWTVSTAVRVLSGTVGGNGCDGGQQCEESPEATITDFVRTGRAQSSLSTE